MTTDRLAVVVPMKPFGQAKQRLRPAVNDGERMALARTMLVHVLSMVAESGVGDLCVLVSADSAVLALAGDYGFTALPEETAGYNDAVRQAIRWSQAKAATAVLVLPADLPQITPSDIQDLVSMAGDAASAVVLAPDASETGTNALFLRPPDLFPPSFGPDSFCRHLELARVLGIKATVYHHHHFAWDVDWPSDLYLLSQRVR